MLDTVLSSLADPTRRQVVELLSDGPKRASTLADAVGVTRPAMSRHLRILLDAGVVRDERLAEDARARVFRLRPDGVVALRAWLDQLKAEWDEQLGAFKQHVERKRR